MLKIDKILGIEREDDTTYHDRQIISINSPVTTGSDTYVDLLSLTTKKVGKTGNYYIGYDSEVSHSNVNGDIYVRIVVDGIVIPHSERRIQVGVDNNDPLDLSTQALVTGVIEGTVIKIQWREEAVSGTASANKASLIIDGVSEKAVVD